MPEPADRSRDGAAGQHLAGSGECADACAGVHRQAAPLLTATLEFADVYPDADAKAALREGRNEFHRSACGVTRSIEHRQYAIPGVLFAGAAVLGQ